MNNDSPPDDDSLVRLPDLTESLYGDLRMLAARLLRKEKGQLTLQPTALVHEAVLRIRCDPDRAVTVAEGYLYCAAAEAMRRILIDQARRRRRQKHGGLLKRVSFSAAAPLAEEAPPADILDLNEALEALERQHPERARIVTLRYFGGLSMSEIASILGISLATAERRWTIARAWLYSRIQHANQNSKDF